MENKAIQGYDLLHQLWRMRNAKNMPDAEVDLILRTLVETVQTYEQVVEVISFHDMYLPPFSLFHYIVIVVITAPRWWPDAP